jgi:heat-inducible transcriptional repressor
MALDERKLHILQAIIDDYIVTAEPVGSRTLARKYIIDISSATIRNEMADLEELGYLEQPHTSAGRVPSDKAYRLYVDRMLELTGLSNVEADSIKTIYKERSRQIEQIIRSASNVLSDITNYTSVILSPQGDCVHVKHIQLVPVGDDLALLIIVTNSGIIKDTVIRIPQGVAPDYLNRISMMLTEEFKNKTLGDIRFDKETKLYHSMNQDQQLFNKLVDAFTLSLAVKEDNNVYMGGMTNIFNFPEYKDVMRARTFLDLMQKKDVLYQLLKSSTEKKGINVSIGQENEVEELKQYSVISATYEMGGRVMGSIGLIGPKRMEYGKAISAIDYVGKSLSQYLTKMLEDK